MADLKVVETSSKVDERTVEKIIPILKQDKLRIYG